MANIAWDDIDNNPATNNNSDTKQGKFFKLPNDGDKARVRFLVNRLEDLEIHTTHRVHTTGNMGKEWDATVECLRTDSGQPVSACPFCEQGIPLKAEIFMQLYNEDTQSLQIWTRSTSFGQQLRALFNSINNLTHGGPVSGAVVEVERHGAKGSKETTYTLSVVSIDGKTLDQLPVKPVDIHTTGCLRLVSWQDANQWSRTGSLPAPAKQTVDGYGRPTAPAPQVAVHEPAPAYVPPTAPVAPAAYPSEEPSGDVEIAQPARGRRPRF